MGRERLVDEQIGTVAGLMSGLQGPGVAGEDDAATVEVEPVADGSRWMWITREQGDPDTVAVV